MSRLTNWLRRYLRDSIVVRVCVFIYGALFLGFGVLLANACLPAESFEWIAVAIGMACAGFGSFMIYASVFGRFKILENTANAVSDGGELLGVVLVLAVFLLAIPIAAAIKWARSPRRLL